MTMTASSSTVNTMSSRLHNVCWYMQDVNSILWHMQDFSNNILWHMQGTHNGILWHVEGASSITTALYNIFLSLWLRAATSTMDTRSLWSSTSTSATRVFVYNKLSSSTPLTTFVSWLSSTTLPLRLHEGIEIEWVALEGDAGTVLGAGPSIRGVVDGEKQRRKWKHKTSNRRNRPHRFHCDWGCTFGDRDRIQV
jgi:hypothetical protein